MTGVIVGVGAMTLENAQRMVEDLETRFPGVTFAVVAGCTALATFPTSPPSEGND